jgi:hypothetical protein
MNSPQTNEASNHAGIIPEGKPKTAGTAQGRPLFTRWADIAGTGCALAVVYFILLTWGGYGENPTASLFSASDAQTYWQVAQWLSGASAAPPPPQASAFRPFFYPLLLSVFHQVGGDTGIWLGQFMLWWARCC